MKKLIIANWKMGVNETQIREFAASFVNKHPNKVEAIVAAPYIYLDELRNNTFHLAAQNVSAFEAGAYTGEISAQMLREQGVKYCLVGHSERRIYFQETDQDISQKIAQLQKVKIIPILCFGETGKERQAKKTMAVIKKQLSVLKKIKNPEKIILAYEPVWAISTFQKSKVKKSASDSEIETIHDAIKQYLGKLLGPSGRKIQLLYGGSVNADNSKGFLNLDAIDGALVGAASIESQSFMAIIHNLK